MSACSDHFVLIAVPIEKLVAWVSMKAPVDALPGQPRAFVSRLSADAPMFDLDHTSSYHACFLTGARSRLSPNAAEFMPMDPSIGFHASQVMLLPLLLHGQNPYVFIETIDMVKIHKLFLDKIDMVTIPMVLYGNMYVNTCYHQKT
jgi:hypothetical protein